MSMLTVHHLNMSQSERIVWLCEELEIPYELVVHARDPVTRLAPPAYKALHPQGTAPVIVDGDRVLAESGAIVEYIVARHAGGRLAVTPERPNYPDYLYWLHFANGSMMANELMRLVGSLLDPKLENPIMQILVARSTTAWTMVEQRLGEVPYFAGPALTAADIMNVFALTTMRLITPRDLASYPNIRAYLKRIGARPAYRRAMEKGDPGMPLMLE
jgi:glutathione S-transferase